MQVMVKAKWSSKRLIIYESILEDNKSRVSGCIQAG